ncbi:MAG TPA: metal-dependent transcriptional regulator [Syntrophorhabdaceae bacterium]|jgi:DtxR family Mn-dependent transcriptional regulator|nr:metal-dependent transcriptional regulator [Syntrophorhabdaceae bacterium]MDI9561190.1 metal-dependent transcriptional regulator [Pseudomonadota bacterium]OQC47875.1 MAG: Transcriptional regulator MntR [Deltaproteobacteria bacterium ADurb.Bin026]MBP8697488.1 metal-dependent transcriptional regulator [Syntrophorhabdaceae bacterium]MBV6504864.1 Transcriptional regulator MntR [Syntrophorhabdaceae bacterium]
MDEKIMKDIKLSSSMEDYLEAIAVLKKENGVARVKDIGNLLNVKNPSVNSALNFLADAGLVVHERYGYADLTEDGMAVANNVIERHNILTRFFTEILGLDRQKAEEDACKIEHFLGDETFNRLTIFMQYAESCREGKTPEWLDGFYRFIQMKEKV